MAGVIAEALDGDLDVVLVRKLRTPGQPELAFGAVDETGHVVGGAFIDEVPERDLEREIQTQLGVLRQQREQYSGERPAPSPAGRVAIIVDDGVATGATVLAAIRLIRAKQPSRLVLAIGVAPASTLAVLSREADEVVCVHAANAFTAVGQFYVDFSDVTDEMVVEALRHPEQK